MHLTLNKLIRTAFSMQQQRVKILHRKQAVGGVLLQFFARDMYACPGISLVTRGCTSALPVPCRCELSLILGILVRDHLANSEEAGGDVPKGGEVGFHAAEDVVFDYRMEGFVAGKGFGFEGAGAVAGVAGEEGGGFTHLVFVVGLLVGEGDDGLVFGVAVGEEAEEFAVEVFACFEEPFELGELLEEFGAFVAGGLGGVGVVQLGVVLEFGLEFVEVVGGFGDAVVEEVVERVEDDVLEGVEFGLDAAFFGGGFVAFHGGFGFGGFGVRDAAFLDLGLDVGAEVASVFGHAGLAVLLERFHAGGVAGAAGGQLGEVRDGADKGTIAEEIGVLVLDGGIVAWVRGRERHKA
jgi:hypothetical protein